MERRLTIALGLLSLSACATAKGSDERVVERAVERVATPGSGLRLSDMDLAADPARDFYRFANGGWLDANPVPSDESSWGVFHEVDRQNQVVLREILEEAARTPSDELHRKLGDIYAMGMDEQAIEARGTEPLAPELARIASLRDASELPALLAHLHSIGCASLFGIGSNADLTDASQNILFLAQDGLGLPEKGYYLRDDEESVGLREAYRGHVAQMLGLSGASAEEAAADAAAVLALETELARASYAALDFRDPSKLLNRIDVAEAEALAPRLQWTVYLTAQGLDPSHPINLIAPDYFANADRLLAERPIEDWRAYLRWRLVSSNAQFLPAAFDAEDFDFYGRILGGAQEQRSRWKRVVDATGGAMGEALGQAFVARTFSPRAKERCLEMVDDLLAVMRRRLENLSWMSAETRAKALEKLSTFTTKIGYPDTWRDWSGLSVGRGSFVENHMRAAEFNFRYDLAKVGQPVDKAEFGIPAFVVNAGYNPLNNDITFPAGILQPPFFGEAYDDALNYGAMGAVIGHEITHGFDDEGSQFDAHGNLANWWTAEDRAEFERRAKLVEEQFSGYEALEGVFVDGKLTLGENLADLAGLTIAYEALEQRLAREPRATIDGFTPEQRFFLAWARAWRNSYTPESLKLQVNTNPHAPANLRAVGPLSNMDAFQAAFGFPDDAPVLRPKASRAVVW